MSKLTRNLITDVRGILVGNACDPAIKSGVTVLTAPEPFVCSVHVMGGAPGTRETDLLAPDRLVEKVDALVLSGGSAFGLDACSGVSDELRSAGRGFAAGRAVVPIVPGAILFDLLNGGDKDWTENPYRDLGRAAFRNAGTAFQIGTAGAGYGALTGTVKGGLGSASAQVAGVTVGALVAVNPVGSVSPEDSRHFWAAPFEQHGEFGGLGPDPSSGHSGKIFGHKIAGRDTTQENTTIAIIATDAALTKAECHRLAVAAHDGIARAIVPAHTPFDGDLVFAVSTGHVGLPDDRAQALSQIGAVAATCLSRAIARGVYEARPETGDLFPAWSARA
ncbi:P1 family peptidase [Roseinatronobacter alkalisoli]|uniref:P1 family peptidase n=1 Tax=Roseinatronobacter alkalisoli TaxID=3028235 RepID=A0ABT5T4R9_9RHOB|nr:P1 family peptidase [Roseinatronobacter sp. HJB301]MDD7969981.1 P1 family peptidase [Roseinatronobacter sp. HJB301]